MKGRGFINPHMQPMLNHPRAGRPQRDANMAVMGFALSGKPCDKAESPKGVQGIYVPLRYRVVHPLCKWDLLQRWLDCRHTLLQGILKQDRNLGSSNPGEAPSALHWYPICSCWCHSLKLLLVRKDHVGVWGNSALGLETSNQYANCTQGTCK